ncbi:MAG: acetate/propionate family kinase [Bdellovibrionaceae bacterium]|nr:acetate/propionate family kinase [Pseudobdellovibrionaceae bacterium]
MKEAFLVINAGSSSIKFSVFFRHQNSLSLGSRGQIEGIGLRPNFLVKDHLGKVLAEKYWENSVEITHDFLMKFLIEWLEVNLQGVKVKAAGHRVVHGGTEFPSPVIVTDDIIAKLEKLIPLAPLHQGHNLAAIKALKKVFPTLPQVACFDTSFHATNPEVLRHFFIPRELEREGVRRYGFHGLSYESITKTLQNLDPEVANKKVIVAHLGSGSSMCALDGGKSVVSSMGLTALDGIPMGTRPGQLDVGVVLYLLREKKMNADQIEDFLYKKSGLLGLSGISNDMRVLEESQDPWVKEAIEAYIWRICQMVGSLAAVVQGMDVLVFTAGIGENSAQIRLKVCERLAWLGVNVDSEVNSNLQKNGFLISTPTSLVKVFVIPTNEELMIAEHILDLVSTC